MEMAQYSILNEDGFPPNAEDLRGARLLGRNHQQLGIVRDVLYEPDTGDLHYLVVEHGAHRHVLVSCDQVDRSANKHHCFLSELTVDDLNRLPAFNPEMMLDIVQWRNYEKLYRTSLPQTANRFGKKTRV